MGPATPEFGSLNQLWSVDLDGAVYAQVLVSGDTALAATENNSVFALDAATGRQRWRTHLGDPVLAGTLPCGNINPSGITGTPVIDPVSATVYAVAFLQPFEHRLFALNLSTGAILWQRAVDAVGAPPRTHQQRGALTLSGGYVYVPFGGLLGDCGQYLGTVVGVPASGQGENFQWRVGAGNRAGIWAPAGAATDQAGNLYVTIGNGASTTTFDYGNAVIRLDPHLRQADYWAPAEWAALNRADTDLGSISPALVDDGLIFQSGKNGTGYLIHAAAMGGIGGTVFSGRACRVGAFGGTAYSEHVIYVPCRFDGISALKISDSRFDQVWHGSRGGNTPVVAYGRVWSIGGQRPGGGLLVGFDLASGTAGPQVNLPSVAPFAAPSAAGGRLFVPAWTQVIAFEPGG